MRYITITSKHHDAFAMWDSKVSDYTVVKRTPYGRDVLKMLAEECHKQRRRSQGETPARPHGPSSPPVAVPRVRGWRVELDWPNVKGWLPFGLPCTSRMHSD